MVNMVIKWNVAQSIIPSHAVTEYQSIDTNTCMIEEY